MMAKLNIFFSLPLESWRGFDISCGMYRIGVKFKKQDDKNFGFFFRFCCNKNTNLSVYAATVELTLLKSDMVTVFLTKILNSNQFLNSLRNEPIYYYGFPEFCSMADLKELADHERKVYFMVTLRDVICVHGNAKH